MMYLNNISFYINPKLCIVVYYIVSHHSKLTIIIIKLDFFGLIKKIILNFKINKKRQSFEFRIKCTCKLDLLKAKFLPFPMVTYAQEHWTK